LTSRKESDEGDIDVTSLTLLPGDAKEAGSGLHEFKDGSFIFTSSVLHFDMFLENLSNITRMPSDARLKEGKMKKGMKDEKKKEREKERMFSSKRRSILERFLLSFFLPNCGLIYNIW